MLSKIALKLSSCPLNPNFLSVFRIFLTLACLEQTWLPAFYNNEHWITAMLSWPYLIWHNSKVEQAHYHSGSRWYLKYCVARNQLGVRKQCHKQITQSVNLTRNLLYTAEDRSHAGCFRGRGSKTDSYNISGVSIRENGFGERRRSRFCN